MITDFAVSEFPSRADVRSFLTELLAEVGRVPVEKIKDGATIDGELRMESVAFVELQVAIEDYYNIEIDPIEVVERGEFGAIVAYIHSCVARAR